MAKKKRKSTRKKAVRRKRGRIVKRQTIRRSGRRSKRKLRADRKRRAMPAGVRRSRNGRPYSERRANRAD